MKTLAAILSFCAMGLIAYGFFLVVPWFSKSAVFFTFLTMIFCIPVSLYLWQPSQINRFSMWGWGYQVVKCWGLAILLFGIGYLIEHLKLWETDLATRGILIGVGGTLLFIGYVVRETTLQAISALLTSRSRPTR